MNLYELSEEYVALKEMLSDENVDEELINDTLDAVGGEIEVKADNYAKIINDFKGDVEKFKVEENRLKSKRQTLEKSIDRLKNNLQDTMVKTGKTKFKTDLFSFNIQKNGGSAPVIVDVETAELPDELVIIEEKPNLKAISELLKTGECKYAHFGERGESLRIK